jgi:hypothetical protein
MVELIKFPSIEQFRNVVKSVRDRAKYHNVPLPILKFNGSVKLHGTNAGVVKDIYTGEIWMQSREQIITPDADNAGFARFMTENPALSVLMNIAAGVYGNTKFVAGDRIAIYGEWCGGSIQKKVALNQLEKMFVIFGIRVIPARDEEEFDNSYWFTPEQLIDVIDGLGRETSDECKIYCIQKFPTFEVEIDFSRPDVIQNHLIELTTEVEKQCPVGKAFGVEGVGEGIVWRCVSEWNFKGDVNNDGNLTDVTLIVPKIRTTDLVFKVKGEKHSDTKVKKLVTVDPVKMNSIHEFASSTVTDHRLEKMIELMTQDGNELDVKNTGIFLGLVGRDILKEEGDTLDASGLERKEVMPVINTLARQWFLSRANQV